MYVTGTARHMTVTTNRCQCGHFSRFVGVIVVQDVSLATPTFEYVFLSVFLVLQSLE